MALIRAPTKRRHRVLVTGHGWHTPAVTLTIGGPSSADLASLTLVTKCFLRPTRDQPPTWRRMANGIVSEIVEGGDPVYLDGKDLSLDADDYQGSRLTSVRHGRSGWRLRSVEPRKDVDAGASQQGYDIDRGDHGRTRRRGATRTSAPESRCSTLSYHRRPQQIRRRPLTRARSRSPFMDDTTKRSNRSRLDRLPCDQGRDWAGAAMTT